MHSFDRRRGPSFVLERLRRARHVLALALSDGVLPGADMLLRAHNLEFREGDDLSSLLLFAEGALVIVIVEHFVRVVLGARATDKHTLPNLLEKAVADGLLWLPWADQQEGIRKVTAVRNTILHGNSAQAAAQAGCASVEDYFKRQFAQEIEGMYRIAQSITEQIDTRTGKPVAK